VCVLSLETFSDQTAAELFSAGVLSDASPPRLGPVCLVSFFSVTVHNLLNRDFRLTFLCLLRLISLNIGLLPSPTNSFSLHAIRCTLYLLTYVLEYSNRCVVKVVILNYENQRSTRHKLTYLW